MKLSRNFSLSEFTKSSSALRLGIDNTPEGEHLEAAKLLFESVVQPVRDEFGILGYCWMHHFKCHSARSCHTWAKGGPIKDDKISYIWGKKAFSK